MMSFARARRTLLTLAVLAGALLSVRPAPADVGPLHGGPTDFVTMSDGVELALSVVYPKNFDPSKTYPAILEMAGYENGSASPDGRTTLGQLHDAYCPDCPEPPLAGDSQAGTSAFRYTDDGSYVMVHASVRGTGCSQGEFDLFSTRSALDGYEIIENWIVKQRWSDQKVGILGHSYSGLTGFMVAAMEGRAAREGRPSHLEAVTVSGLIDDLYRGITYPGGIFNGLFPPAWTLGIRMAYDVLGGTAQGVVRNLDNETAQRCARNAATHRRTVLNDPVVQGVNEFDNDWWRARSLISYARDINVPFHITGAFQDEQTGPRGFTHLWEAIPEVTTIAGHQTFVPKRLLITNGDHGTQVDAFETWADRKAWMDWWMRGVFDPRFSNPSQHTFVRTLFELHPTANGLQSNAVLDASKFPLEDTAWTPYYLCAGQATIASAASGCAGGTATYLSGSKRQSWSYQAGPTFGSEVTTPEAPDELDFRSAVVPAGQQLVIDGPITANLFLDTSANDTQMFVQVIDEDTTTGALSFLQRGLLKASHRAVDANLSDYDALHADPLNPSQPFLYRPFRPHTSAVDVTPLDPVEYLVEIFPVAHVFRPGHRLLVKIMAPPAVDSYYAYAPHEMPLALNTLHFDASMPSRITLPVIPGFTVGGTMPPCGQYHEVRCVTP